MGKLNYIMFKTALRWALLTCFGGALLSSCHEEDKVSAPAGAYSAQNSNAMLVEEMVQDELIREDYVATTAFLRKNIDWFRSLSGTAQKERLALMNKALESGSPISDPSHTAAETAAFATAMQEREERIDAKFPALAALKSSAQSEVIARVYQQLRLAGLGGENPETLEGNCGAGYRACCRSCRDNFQGSQYARCIDGCYAGWYACYFSSSPIRP